MRRRFQVTNPLIHNSTFSWFKAWDHVQKKHVCVFIFSNSLAQQYPHFIPAIERQLSINAGLAHPLIARTHAIMRYENTLFFVEEIPEGPTLADILEEGRRQKRPLTPTEATRITLLLCEALQYAHQYTSHGFLHPGDIFLTNGYGVDGVPLITHFGVRSCLRIANEGLSGLPSGLAAYAPPEFLSGGELTVEADIYGLGALLYEMMTLRSPTGCFIGPSTLHAEAFEDVDRFVLRALEEMPQARYKDADSCAGELSRLAGIERKRIFSEIQICHTVGDGQRPGKVLFPRLVRGSTCAWILLVLINAALLLGAAPGFLIHKEKNSPENTQVKEWEEVFRRVMLQQGHYPGMPEAGQAMVRASTVEGSDTVH